MFDERAFVTNKQAQWQELTLVVERVKGQGLRAIPAKELARLGLLYRRAAADLAYARTQRATAELVFYLNELVGQGHGVVYQQPGGRSVWAGLRDFFAWELPATLRRRTPFVFTAFLLTFIGALIAYGLVRHHASNLDLFVPAGMQDSFDAWKQGFADHDTISAGEGAEFAAMLMTHNITVGLFAFATGISTLLPAYFMMLNGFELGALVADVQPTGHSVSMWAGLLPHGVCELSAIFIAGGAGLLTGWALISPGRLTRRDALTANSKDAVKMLMATIPLLIIAGTIEGNVSHASLPHWMKFSLAAVQFTALLYYIYGNWTKPTRQTQAAAVELQA